MRRPSGWDGNPPADDGKPKIKMRPDQPRADVEKEQRSATTIKNADNPRRDGHGRGEGNAAESKTSPSVRTHGTQQKPSPYWQPRNGPDADTPATARMSGDYLKPNRNEGEKTMQLLKCKAGQLLAEMDGGYWIFTPNHGKLFYGCDREKAVAAWRWYVNREIRKGE